MTNERYHEAIYRLNTEIRAHNDTLELNRKLGSENEQLKKEIGYFRTIKDDYKKLLKEIKEELAEKEIDLEYLKYHLISDTIADWGRITKEDWEEE